MFRRLRIAVLLYILVFVAVAQFLTRAGAHHGTRRCGSASTRSMATIAALPAAISTASRRPSSATWKHFSLRRRTVTAVSLDQPFRLRIVGQYADGLPTLASDAGALGTLWWSLRMRWVATRLQWRSATPAGDILVFAVFHEPAAELALDRSTALRKGMIAVANLFADDKARGSNNMVLAHELLHTLGATDKYVPGTNAPRFPDGYATPDAKPLLPQTKAELMAGRIPLDAQHAEIPSTLRQVVIGPATAREIGWPSP